MMGLVKYIVLILLLIVQAQQKKSFTCYLWKSIDPVIKARLESKNMLSTLTTYKNTKCKEKEKLCFVSYYI